MKHKKTYKYEIKKKLFLVGEIIKNYFLFLSS